MSQAPLSAPATNGSPIRVTIRAVWVSTLLLIMFSAGADVAVLRQSREDTLRNAEKSLSAMVLTLAEQADRAMQGVDLVLGDVARYAAAGGAVDAASFDQVMSAREANVTLRQRMIGLPQINALLVVSVSGYLENSTRSWPVAPIDVRDRGYFKLLINDPNLEMMVTEPMHARGDGTWTMFLIRKMRGPDGAPIGLLVAAIELRYFEEFYHAVTRGEEASTVLVHEDGTILARFPAVGMTGHNFHTARRVLGNAMAGTIREDSPIDGTARIKAARRLNSYPMAVLVSLEEALVLREWRHMAQVLSFATFGSMLAIVIAAAAMSRRWRQEHALSGERENRALAEAALMRERERSAEAESQAKSRFLAMMSHEIRTPMNGVLGLAGTLLDTSLSVHQQKMVEAIRDSGDSLLRILNDILDFSKLDAGKMLLEESAFSPATLTQNPVSLLGPRASAKGLTISAICADGLPDAVLGDAGRLRQVLLNLVSNSLKFTERGSVSVSIACPDRSGGAATLVWRVSDTGIGIPADRIGGLFGEFTQADASITRRFGGSGLGLAISRRLIEQMGGTIEVESQPELGSTFTITVRLKTTAKLPDEIAAPFNVAAALDDRLAALGRPARILLAEDNPTNQFVALQLLRGFDMQTDVVGDGLEAVHAATSFLYDVICMDMRMPDMDGLTATRAIRARGGHLANVPIIALTANAFPEDVAACFDAGMNGFVAKPVRKDAFLAALLTALSPVAAAREHQVSPGPETTLDALDREAISRLRDDIGEEGAEELIRMFEAETRSRLATIANPALDAVTRLREVHSLKGAASTACAPALSRLAAELEIALTKGGRMDAVDLAALTAAFEAWLTAVGTLVPERVLAA